MIKWMGGIFDRIFAVGGAFILSQAPLFMQQYKQQLVGHVAELQTQIALMQNAAILSGKTLPQLVDKFLSSQDPDFIRQGELMTLLVSRWENFSSAYTALNDASIWTRPFVFIKHLNLDIFKSTFHSFDLGIALNFEGLCYGLAGIGLGYLIFFIIKQGVKIIFSPILKGMHLSKKKSANLNP